MLWDAGTVEATPGYPAGPGDTGSRPFKASLVLVPITAPLCDSSLTATCGPRKKSGYTARTLRIVCVSVCECVCEYARVRLLGGGGEQVGRHLTTKSDHTHTPSQTN